MKNFLEGKVGFFIMLLLLSFNVLAWLDYREYLNKKFVWHDILVESHGLAFDLFVFGTVITYYEIRKQKQEEIINKIKDRENLIARYTEEIDDFRHWKSEEAMYRIIGLAKRLEKLGFREINLSNCHFPKQHIYAHFKDMSEWSFFGAILNETQFRENTLIKTEFTFAILYKTTFFESNLTNADFKYADLTNVIFKNCDLTNIKLDQNFVKGMNWFEELEQEGNIGVSAIKEKYYIEVRHFANNPPEQQEKYYLMKKPNILQQRTH